MTTLHRSSGYCSVPSLKLSVDSTGLLHAAERYTSISGWDYLLATFSISTSIARVDVHFFLDHSSARSVRTRESSYSRRGVFEPL